MSRSRLTLAALALLATTTAPARADILATPPVYSAPNTGAECVIFNSGAPAITFVLARIMKSDGAAMPVAGNSCTGGLAPNKGCLIVVLASPVTNYILCKVVTRNSAANLRGTLTIFNGGQAQASSELR